MGSYARRASTAILLWVLLVDLAKGYVHATSDLQNDSQVEQGLTTRLPKSVKGATSEFRCHRTGHFPVPGSCKLFYQCEEFPGYGLTPILFACPARTVFDKNSGLCKLPSPVATETNCTVVDGNDTRVGGTAVFPPAGTVVYDTLTLKRQKRESKMFITGVSLLAYSLGVGLFNTIASKPKHNVIDLKGVESKLSGMEAHLSGANLQLLVSQSENKVSSKITQNLLKEVLIDNQMNFRDTQDLLHQGISRSNTNAAIIQGSIVQGNAANEKQFSEVHQSLGKLKELINQEMVKVKTEIQMGYISVSSAIEQVKVESLVSRLLTSINGFVHKFNHLLSLPEKNKKDEIERKGGYIDYLQSTTLQEILYDIVHQKLAIPRSDSDLSAVFILDLLVDGLQIHTSKLSAIVSSNVYLTGKALEERNLEDFNTYMLRVTSSVLRMKLILGFDNEHGLIKEVSAVMNNIRQLPYASQIRGLDELLSEKESILEQLMLTISQFVLENTQLDEPEQILQRPDFTTSSIPFSFGPWKTGKKVMYAIQFVSKEGISPIGVWSRPYTFFDETNPIIYLKPAKDSVTRIVYRKFDEERPELVAIMTDSEQNSFRDIDRDLINAVARPNQDLGVTEVRRMLEEGADVNITLEHKMTPLHYAAKYNNVEIMKILLDETADIHSKSSDNETALHFAALSGSKDALEYLINEGAYIDDRALSFGWSPLHIATAMNQPGAAEILIRNDASINIKDNKGLTPLHLSILGNGETMEILLAENTTEVNAQDNDGQTPLHHAARSSRASLAKLLLDHHEVEVDALSDTLISPLHSAAMSGDVEVITTLIDHNASVLLADEDGSTPLHYAAFYGNAVATLLIMSQNESLISLENKEGETALDQAVGNNNIDVIRILRNDTEMVEDNPDSLGMSPSADMAEPEYSLETIDCTSQVVQEIAVHSEETCEQMGHITNYIEVIMSMLPVPIRHLDQDALTNIANNYNQGLQNAKTNANLWRNGDSIFGNIQKTFRLAKAFEESFNKKYKIKQESILAMSHNAHEEDTTKSKGDISDLENNIRKTQALLAAVTVPDIKDFLQNQIRNLEAELEAKKRKNSIDSTTLYKLEELIYFLELVRTEAYKVKQTAVTTKQRTTIFHDHVHEDKELFDSIHERAKSHLRNLERQSIQNNLELTVIHDTQEILEAEVEAHKRKVSDLYNKIYETQRQRREKRRELLKKFEKVSVMKYVSAALGPLKVISLPLLYFANIKDRKLIESWQDNISTSKTEGDIIRSMIKNKEQLIVQHRETIANGTRNSQTLVKELNTFNRLDYELQNILIEVPSLQPSLAQVKAGLQKIEDVFTHIAQAMSEMIDMGKAANTEEKMKSVLQSTQEHLTTLQCYWKGSTLYISDMAGCSETYNNSNLGPK